MDYCTLDNVKGEFKNLDLATETGRGITEAEISEFIVQASALIDSQISNCYVLPIDDSDPANASILSSLTMACTWLVADRIISILQVKNRTQNIEQTGQDRISYYSKAKSVLNMICPAKKTGLTAPAKKDSSSGIDYYDEQETFFERDTDQW